MFDEPPANLPVDPNDGKSSGAGPVPKPPIGDDLQAAAAGNTPARTPAPAPAPAPRPAAPPAPVASPQEMPPQAPPPSAPRSSREPEDMFGDLSEKTPTPGKAEAPLFPDDEPRAGGAMRMALFGLGGLVVVVVLVIAGFYVYAQFFNAPQEPAPITATEEDAMENDVMEPDPIEEEDFMEPDVVTLPPPEETEPAPEDLPPPNEVTPSAPIADTDGDGLTDMREQELGTDPRAADTDGDGLTDGEEESVHQTDPTVADTDGDGLTDGDEVRVWRTNPTQQDTDGDGYTDGQEIQNGFNPLGPGSL